MFSKTKRVAGVMLAAAMIVTSFAGCGGNTTEPGSSQAGNTSSGAQTTEIKAISVDEMMADAELALGTEGKDSEVTLKVWEIGRAHV